VTFWSIAAILFVYLATSAAPTPLYVVYQDEWGFSATTLTLVFAVYVFGLLATLLVVGRLSDHVGRRPMIAVSLALEVLAMAIFILAGGVAVLALARVVQGVATGIALTAMGATLAVLAGINNISGPGMLDFESCFSLEKLVLDNEICGMTLRMAKGIEPKEDFPATPRFEELLKEQHLLISKHTRRYLKEEHYFPGAVVDRANRSRWTEDGSLTLGERAHREVNKHLAAYAPSGLPDDIKRTLSELMEEEARRYGMDTLPHTRQ